MIMSKNMKENRMGTDPVPQVLLKMGIPIICSLVLQACYNIVDSMFVARMPDMNGIAHSGELGVNALTLAFPIQMLIIAFGVGTGVGVNALLSRSLGQKNTKKLALAAGNGVTLGIIIYLCFVLFGIFGIRGYLTSQTSDADILNMATTYLQICTFLSIFIIEFGIYEKFLQSTGKTIYSTIAQISGALTNIVFDPIMIYGLLGCPAMGIAGAAWATVLGQMVSFVLAAFFQYTKNKEIPSGIIYLKPDGRTIREIYSIGTSAIIMQALMSVMTYGVNIIFGHVSSSAVTAYGIFYKIQQFIFFAGFGIRDAVTPLISYNYGMGSQKRVREGIRYGLIDTEIIMLAGILILELFAHPLARVFGLTAGTETLCVRAMRMIAPGFIFAGISIAAQGVFQALESGTYSLIVSLLRLLIVVLPLCWIFSQTNDPETMIWLAFPISEAISAVVAVFLMKKAERTKVEVMKNWGRSAS
jgi:multidrug efflux pump